MKSGFGKNTEVKYVYRVLEVMSETPSKQFNNQGRLVNDLAASRRQQVDANDEPLGRHHKPHRALGTTGRRFGCCRSALGAKARKG